MQQLRKNVVYAQSAKAVRDVFVDGKRVVNDGKLTTVTEEQVAEQVARLTASWR